MKRLFVVLPLFLSACVGGTLSDTREFEEYMVRPATKKEAERLERCLRAVRDEQNRVFKKMKRYLGRATELGVDEPCSGIALALRSRGDSYTALVQLNENEHTVRWTMDENGQITEDADMGIEEDLEL